MPLGKLALSFLYLHLNANCLLQDNVDLDDSTSAGDATGSNANSSIPGLAGGGGSEGIPGN